MINDHGKLDSRVRTDDFSSMILREDVIELEVSLMVLLIVERKDGN